MKKILPIAGVAVLIVGAFFIFHHPPICPDDFATVEEATTATNAWTNTYYDSHPGASLSEWAQARHEFYVQHRCTAALERYEQANTGKADPATMERIQQGIQDAVNNPTP